MRLSIEDREGTDSYKSKLTQRAVIFIDGKRVNRVIWADEEQGCLERYVDFDKQPRGWHTTLATETLFGKVKIIDPEQINLDEVYSK